MSVQEKLARLNPKTQNWSDSGGGYGGMTAQDLAAAMAGCDPIGEMVIRRRYLDSGDKSIGYYSLLRMVIMEVYDSAREMGMIQPVFDIALDDYIGGFLWKTCHGRQEVTVKGITRKCHSRRCVRGYRQRLDYERANILGVKAKQWERLYKPIYEHISKYLTKTLPEKEGEAMRTVMKQARWIHA